MLQRFGAIAAGRGQSTPNRQPPFLVANYAGLRSAAALLRFRRRIFSIFQLHSNLDSLTLEHFMGW
jgi:hypothetical protein